MPLADFYTSNCLNACMLVESSFWLKVYKGSLFFHNLSKQKIFSSYDPPFLKIFIPPLLEDFLEIDLDLNIGIDYVLLKLINNDY